MASQRSAQVDRRAHGARSNAPKYNDFKTLAEFLTEAGFMVTSRRRVFRRVDSVVADQVVLDFDGAMVPVPAALLPKGLKPDQWVRFEKKGDQVIATVDLEATLTAESRISGLFKTLVR